MRFSLFGTPIRVNFTFPLVVIGLSLLSTRDPRLIAGWLALVTVSVIVHEFGHVAALRAFGYRPEVSLVAMGGLTSTEQSGALSHWRSILVSVAGPVAGILLGVSIELALSPYDGRSVDLLASASWIVNIWWSAFNLLPIMPLDGGHVLREFFEMASRRRGAAVAWLIALVSALSLGFWFALRDRFPLIAVGIIVLMIATNIRYFAITRRQLQLQSIEIGHEQLSGGDLDEGLARLVPVAFSTDSALINSQTYTTLGWALLHQRRFDELAHLDPARFHPNHRALLTAATSWYRGDLPGAFALVTHALRDGPIDPPDSYFGRVFGRLGEVDRLVQGIGQLPAEESLRAGSRLHTALVAAHTAA